MCLLDESSAGAATGVAGVIGWPSDIWIARSISASSSAAAAAAAAAGSGPAAAGSTTSQSEMPQI